MSINGVEEDWQLIIATPSAASGAPQAGTYMNPAGVSSTHFVFFELNYRDQPSFQGGGLEVVAWGDSSHPDDYASQNSALCQTNNEIITWTQRMVLPGTGGNYQIVGGKSITWGNFGDGSNLAVSFPTSTTSFSGYSPAISLADSGVSFAGNIVTSMTFIQVRYCEGPSLISVDTNLRHAAL